MIDDLSAGISDFHFISKVKKNICRSFYGLNIENELITLYETLLFFEHLLSTCPLFYTDVANLGLMAITYGFQNSNNLNAMTFTYKVMFFPYIPIITEICSLYNLNIFRLKFKPRSQSDNIIIYLQILGIVSSSKYLNLDLLLNPEVDKLKQIRTLIISEPQVPNKWSYPWENHL